MVTTSGVSRRACRAAVMPVSCATHRGVTKCTVCQDAGLISSKGKTCNHLAQVKERRAQAGEHTAELCYREREV